MKKERTELEALAASTLTEHRLSSIPIDPVALAGRLGIKVFNAKFSDDSLAAMLTRRGDSVTILVNQDDPPFRKRFSIGHEIAHHLLHLTSDGDISDDASDLFRSAGPADRDDPDWYREVEANQYAAALLMPAPDVKEHWQRTRNLTALARLFNVSEEAMGIRLSTLGLG